MITPEEAQRIYSEADCLHTRVEVEAVLQNMGEAITARLAGTYPLVLCVLTGAIVPMGNLLTHLPFLLQIDYLHVTRYGDNTRGGGLEWIAKPVTPLSGRTVLVIDDILDEGLTLAAIVEDCRTMGAKAIYTAVLAEKCHSRKPTAITADFVGFQLEDRYIFGYGMDYKGYLRNADGIYAVKGM